MSGPDPEIARALMTLQQKMVETQTNMRLADLQINSKVTNVRKSQLTLNEISTLPADVRVYKSIGRMFLLQPHGEICGELSAKMKDDQAAIEKLKEKKTYLERSMKDSEQSVRELIRQKARA
eukprot:m.226459 g.226459  ORF g.226459 m.226459 type:complete len:122 (+) comp11426_c0_seq1:32-397(+)